MPAQPRYSLTVTLTLAEYEALTATCSELGISKNAAAKRGLTLLGLELVKAAARKEGIR